MSRSESTLKQLEREIAACDAELEQLSASLQELQEKHKRIEEDRQALERVLKRLGAEPTRPDRKVTSESDEESVRKMAFRQAVLHTLTQSNRGMGPADVARSLKKAGYKVKGTTAIETRVGNELHKLSKTGRVLRIKRGVYQVTPDELRDLLQ